MERGEPPGWQEQTDAQSADMTWEGAPIVPHGRKSPIKKENPKAVRRTISFPGQLTERRSPFAKYVEDRCHEIEMAVRAFPGLNAVLSHSIVTAKNGNGPQVKTDFTVTFEPRYREESRVQEILLDVIVDDALEGLAKSYRGEFARAFEKAPSPLGDAPAHPLIAHHPKEANANPGTGAVELARHDETPPRDNEHRKDDGGPIRLEATRA